MPSSSVFMADIVRGIPWDLHGAPAILETFDVSLRPDICVAGDQDDFWKDHARGLPKRAISLLSQSIATRVMSMQIERGIEVDFLKLTRRVLSYDCLPAIAYYWLSEGSREMTRNSKDQKRMAFRMLAFFYTLRVQSQSAYYDVFESVFGFLIDQLARRDNHKDFGIGVDSDSLWLLDFDPPKRKRSESACNESEEQHPKKAKSQPNSSANLTFADALAARLQADEKALLDSWSQVRRRRSVKNLTLETVRKPPTHVFQKISATAQTSSTPVPDAMSPSPASFLTDPLALARDASSALVEEAADKTR
ncbi:hypothetical protein K523DRAFT_352519 [Schizophyllum commune Tattone D]|nr:hypothetical protein K523DRAFT_352519 [Schizophyllum commune Tattone D]